MRQTKIDPRLVMLLRKHLMELVDRSLDGILDATAEDGTMQQCSNRAESPEGLTFDLRFDVPWMSPELFEKVGREELMN